MTVNTTLPTKYPCSQTFLTNEQKHNGLHFNCSVISKYHLLHEKL